MAPRYRPLLHRGARSRRAELHRQLGLDPAGDPLLDTPFDPGLHTVHFDRLSGELLDQLHTIEHVKDPMTQRLARRRVALWVRENDGYKVPGRLVPVIQQYFRQRAGLPEAPALGPDVNCFPGLVDPIVPATLNEYGRAVVQPAAGIQISRLTAELFRTAPTRRMAVVCSNRRAVGQLTRDLQQVGVNAKAYFDHTIDGCPRPAVAVGTPAGLASPSVAIDHVGLVVVIDPVWFCETAGIPLRMVANLVRVPWLGIVPSGRTLSPLGRDIVTCFFGPFHVELPAHGQVTRRVLVTHQPIVLPAGQGYDRMVMALACELADHDRGETEGRFAVVSQTVDMSGPVVVLAQDDRHRHTLRRVLRPEGCERVRVVTPDELSRLASVGILVRADRRPHGPSFSHAARVEPQVARTPLLIVDAPGPDERLVRQRAAEYRAESWVSLTAFTGGWAEWESWQYCPLPGERISNNCGQTNP